MNLPFASSRFSLRDFPIMAAVMVVLVATLMTGCFAPQSVRPGIDQAKVGAEIQKQKEYTVRQFLKNKSRVNKVAWSILAYNAEICKKSSNKLGMDLITVYDMNKDFEQAYYNVFSNSKRLTIFDVFPNGPAERAGLMRGDVIIGINDDEIPESSSARSKFNEMFAKHAANGPVVYLRIERNNSMMNVPITTEKACSPNVYIQENPDVNAFANGQDIVVYTGLLRFTENDDELALIIGHELAHNDCGHLDAKRTNALGGALLGGLFTALTGVNMVNSFANVGAGAYSQEYEHEADYVGLYYSARAKFDVTFAPDFWRRMGAEHPGVISRGSTHPPTAERFVALESTIKELQDKQARGEFLQPNFKK